MFTSIQFGVKLKLKVYLQFALHVARLLSAQSLDTILSEKMNVGWLNGYFSITTSEEDRRTFVVTHLNQVQVCKSPQVTTWIWEGLYWFKIHRRETCQSVQSRLTNFQCTETRGKAVYLCWFFFNYSFRYRWCLESLGMSFILMLLLSSFLTSTNALLYIKKFWITAVTKPFRTLIL